MCVCGKVEGVYGMGAEGCMDMCEEGWRLYGWGLRGCMELGVKGQDENCYDCTCSHYIYIYHIIVCDTGYFAAHLH